MFKRPRPKETEQDRLWLRQLKAVIETQIARRPFLFQMRAVARQLRYERAHWPVLIPFLLLVFLVVYRRERARVLEVARRLAQ
ncbi:MAG: hypothetical protein RMK84_13465 [Oscillochloridaceae bacterium]|nr:hypothetical protein [Chloroflexaceae bacterium]MDW8391129.1 hypothetical protein [Oscillochloridaceae bacterium]